MAPYGLQDVQLEIMIWHTIWQDIMTRMAGFLSVA